MCFLIYRDGWESSIKRTLNSCQIINHGSFPEHMG